MTKLLYAPCSLPVVMCLVALHALPLYVAVRGVAFKQLWGAPWHACLCSQSPARIVPPTPPAGPIYGRLHLGGRAQALDCCQGGLWRRCLPSPSLLLCVSMSWWHLRGLVHAARCTLALTLDIASIAQLHCWRRSYPGASLLFAQPSLAGPASSGASSRQCWDRSLHCAVAPTHGALQRYDSRRCCG